MGTISSPLKSLLILSAYLCFMLSAASMFVGWVYAIDSLLSSKNKNNYIKSLVRPVGFLPMALSVMANLATVELVLGPLRASERADRVFRWLPSRRLASMSNNGVDMPSRSSAAPGRKETSPRSVLTRCTFRVLRLPDSVFIFVTTDLLAFMGAWVISEWIVQLAPAWPIAVKAGVLSVPLMMACLQSAAMFKLVANGNMPDPRATDGR